jgi:hypothetical protein
MTCPKCRGLLVMECDPEERLLYRRCLNCGKYLHLDAPHPVYDALRPVAAGNNTTRKKLSLEERQARARDYARAYYKLHRAGQVRGKLCAKCARLHLPDSTFCHACREKNRAHARSAWRANHPHAEARA